MCGGSSSGLARAGPSRYAGTMFDFALSLVVLAAVALVAGAIFLYRKGKHKQAGLMVLLAVIMALNVAIWTIPTPGGDSLANAAARASE